MSVRRVAGLLVVAACVGVVLASTSVAAPKAGGACVRGSWVANTAESDRFLQRILGSSILRFRRGALTATFADGKLTYGGLSLVLIGGGGENELTIKNTVDLIAKAPYRVEGSRLALGAGKYKIHYVSVIISLGGQSKPSTRPPDRTISTPGGSVPFTCAGGTLRWRVPLPAGSAGTWLTFHRDRG